MLKPLPPLKTLPAFIAVAHYLSFSQAARTLHVTHSAISQSIKLLETYLGQSVKVRKLLSQVQESATTARYVVP